MKRRKIMEHNHHNQYKLTLPYPKVISMDGCDAHDVKLIFPLYSGVIGEFTAIAQYSYQHFVFDEKYPDVSDCIMGIGMVEMHHLQYLGEAIKKLGGDPKFVNPQKKYWWDGGLVYYNQDLCKALLADLKGETEAYHDYMETAKKVKNPTLAALLERIAMDEKLHMEIFTDMINNCCRKSKYC